MSVSTDMQEGWAGFGLAPGCALRVFGLRRSGNHAIINWLIRNAPFDGSVFFNNCAPGQSPVDSCSSLEINRALHPFKTRDPVTARSVLAGAGDRPLVVVSYEDSLPHSAATGGIGQSGFDHQILIYRGFMNWCASLLKKLQTHPDYTSITRMRVLMRGIEQYRKSLARVAKSAATGLVGICFDLWRSSATYRRKRLNRLGFPHRDNTIGAIQRYGGGSSFEDQEGQVDRRWTQMMDNSEYQVALWLAAQDSGLIAAMKDEFPQDADFLASMAGKPADLRLAEVVS